MACDIATLQATACENGYRGLIDRKLKEVLLVLLCNATPLSGTGSPEGAVAASPTRQYVQTDGGGALWVKITGTGNMGWIQIGP